MTESPTSSVGHAVADRLHDARDLVAERERQRTLK